MSGVTPRSIAIGRPLIVRQENNNNYMELEPKYLSYEEKIDCIETIEASNAITDEDIIMLDAFSRDKESEVRMRVAEILVLSNLPSAEKILISLLKDSDDLVRGNACDSLCISNNSEVIELLKTRVMKDLSSLVRGYATLSIADIAIKIDYKLEELIYFFRLLLEQEKVEWVRINVYRTLYMLGDESSLSSLINSLYSRKYRNRIATISCLKDIVSSKNHALIKSALSERLKIEKSHAVSSNITNLLENI